MAGIREVEGRDLILFSSTSYTPEEDFTLVVNALKLVDEELQKERNERQGPGIHLIVTGKGPLKDTFQALFDECNDSLKYVTIETMWLEIEDYPKLVGSADLGVCLHNSTSGLDLPMKVVDMFAAQLGKPLLYQISLISKFRLTGDKLRKHLRAREG